MTRTPCTDVQPALTPVIVHLPDGSTMTSTHTCSINLPGLPLAARKAHLFPALADHALLSVGQLCDHGCNVTFTSNDVTIALHQKTLFTGTRAANGLWAVTLSHQNHCAKAAAIISPPSTNTSELLQYLHACCFSPRKATWLNAIRNGHFTTWPGLTVSNVTKLLPDSIATALRHMDQQRKNYRSTQEPLDTDDTDAISPSPLSDGKRTNFLYATIEEIPSPKGAIASDQTGRFPVISARGMQYLIVVYDYDSNAILAEPLMNRTAKEILRAYASIHTLLVTRGLRPRLQRLDNEASNILKDFMTQEDIDFQLVPPGMHRRNSAERAILTSKNHFIAGLCSTNPSLLLYVWDKLVVHANLMLNLIRQSCMSPQLSAYSQIHGTFDFNRTP